MLEEVAMLEELAFWIQVVENRICKPLLASREDSDFKVLVSHLQAFLDEGSHGKTGSDGRLRKRIEDRYFNFRVKVLFLVVVILLFDLRPLDMDQGLIEVEKQQLVVAWLSEE